jgi:hypothetical protein
MGGRRQGKSGAAYLPSHNLAVLTGLFNTKTAVQKITSENLHDNHDDHEMINLV